MTDTSAPNNFGVPTPTPYPYKNVPPWPTTVGVQPAGLPLHSCMGLNCCAGSDRFGIHGPNGNDPNKCAGQGYCSTTADHTCHVKNDCRNQGGCGLYGTADEQAQPGVNECRAFGSCATPINGERFSTDGPNAGKSVWVRAREVFKQIYPSLRLEVIDNNPMVRPPEELGPVPRPFEETGPTYLWISNDNQDRGNMTACGQSGMSGAGGCA
jgi:hypothetical protein